MSGETQQEPSGWSIDTLRSYLLAMIESNDRKYTERSEAQQAAMKTAFDAQQTAMAAALAAQKLAVDTAMIAADRAVTKAELAADKRFESVNEFRSTLADQQRAFIPRAEVELVFRTLNDKLVDIQINNDNKLEGYRLNNERINDQITKEIASLRVYTATLITQESHAQLINRISTLEQLNANLQGRIWAIGVGLTVLTTIVSIALHFIK